MRSITLSALSMVCLLAACSTGNQNTDGSENSSKRRQFEENRLMDPLLGRIPPSIRTRELAFAQTLPGAHGNAKANSDDVQALASFRPIGPWNIGGRTRALVMDVQDTNVLVAGGVSGGLWRSENGGSDWALITPPDELHNVTSLVQDRRAGKSNVWYYGTGESYGNSAQITGNGIWRSIDGGKTFNVLPSTVSSTTPSSHAFAYSWRLVMNPIAETETILDATTRNGIWMSANAGSTWEHVLGSDSYFADVAVTDSGVYYAALSTFTGYSNTTARQYGFFRSVDGKNWVNISPPDLPKTLNRAVIGVVPGTNSMFVIAETPGTGALGKFLLRTGVREEWHSLWKYTYLSADGTGNGGVWENRSDNIPLLGGRNGDFFTQGGYDMLVRVSAHDTNMVFLGGTNLYRSTDAFRTDQHLSQQGGYGLPTPTERYPSWPNHHPDNHEVLFHPTNGKVLFSANDGGLARTNNLEADTVEWISLNNGYLTTQHYAVSMRMDSATNDVMGGMQDNGTWATNTTEVVTPWIRRNGGDGSYSAFAEHGTVLYVSSQQGSIRRVIVAEDGSEVSRTRIDPIGPKPDDYLFVNPFAIDPNNEDVMYLPAGQIVYRNTSLHSIPMGSDDSTNIGWDTLGNTRIMSGQITSIVASTTPLHIVYYGTSTGKMYRIDAADAGQPSVLDISKGLPTNYINSISVDPRDANHVLISYSNYGVISIYASSDGGASWRAISGNLEEQPSGIGNGPAVLWTEIVPFSNEVDVYVAGTSTGLYFTSQLNGMSTVWTQIASEELGNVPIDMVVARHLDKRVLVATHGRGVFVGTINSIPPATGTPTLISPPNFSRGVYPDTSVSWNAVDGAVSYRVELSKSEDFSDSVVTIDGVRATTASVTSLDEGLQRYYWRVTAFGSGGKGYPSEPWWFVTLIRPPLLLSPPNRADGVSGLPVTLTWEHVMGASNYDVQVAPNLAFTTLVYEANAVTDTTVGATNLSSNTRYFWRVRSRNADTVSNWTVRSQFITGVLSSVDEWKGASELRVLPNPVVDYVAIETPNQSQVQLQIIDGNGTIVIGVADYRDGQRLSVKQLSSGTYIVRTMVGSKKYSAQFAIVR